MQIACASDQCIGTQLVICSGYMYEAEPILGLCPANERRRYKVTPSLIGWTQTWNQPCEDIAQMLYQFVKFSRDYPRMLRHITMTLMYCDLFQHTTTQSHRDINMVFHVLATPRCSGGRGQSSIRWRQCMLFICTLGTLTQAGWCH